MVTIINKYIKKQNLNFCYNQNLFNKSSLINFRRGLH